MTAAILATLVSASGPMPEIRVERPGAGAGSKGPTEVVDALRPLGGEPVGAGEPGQPWPELGAAAV